MDDTEIDDKSELRLVDLVGCPECGKSYIQKNIYRHVMSQHNWTKEECKNLISVIKHEKRMLNGINTYACDICEHVFKNFYLMVKHRKLCMAQAKMNSECVEDEEVDVVGPCYVEELEEPADIGDDLPETSNSSTLNFKDIAEPQFQVKKIEPVDEEDGSSFKRENQEAMIEYNAESSPTSTQKELMVSVLKVPKQISLEPDTELTKILNRYRGSQLTCPECHERCDSCDDLVSHCRDNHQTAERKFIMEQQVFDTYNDFKRWFDQRQEDSCTSLTKRTGHGGETFYRCHRVGKYSSVAKTRKSNPRKLDQSCTAFLKVYTHPDGHTFACGCFTHIGHELDHKLLWLTETQENYVRDLIDLGWNSDQIYYYIRDEYDNYECKLKYISKNDIRNITVRHKKAKAMKTNSSESDEKNPEEGDSSSSPERVKFRKRHCDSEPSVAPKHISLKMSCIDELLNFSRKINRIQERSPSCEEPQKKVEDEEQGTSQPSETQE